MITAAIQLMLVYVLLAFSVHVAVRAGMFSLAGVAFYGVGGYIAAILVGQKVFMPVAILTAVALTAVLGFGLSLLLGRLRNLYLGMATIACVLLVRVLALEGGDLTNGAIGMFGIRGGYTIPMAIGVAIVVAAGIFLLERGRSGRTLEALRLDEQLAESAGIAVVRTRRMAFTLSSALGGLAGASGALLFKIFTPDDVSFALIVNALTMLVLGGAAAWYGPIIGAVIVAWLPVVLVFADHYRLAIQALVVVVVMIFAPEGAVGLIRSLRERWRKRRGSGPRAERSEPSKETAGVVS